MNEPVRDAALAHLVSVSAIEKLAKSLITKLTGTDMSASLQRLIAHRWGVYQALSSVPVCSLGLCPNQTDAQQNHTDRQDQRSRI
jgi:hypothetical protein